MNDLSKRPRILWIESLRGLACLCVVIQHYLPVGTSAFNFGNFGVVVFFLISGFIVTTTVMPPRQISFLDFIILRVGRLYPAYWISLIFVLLVSFPSAYETLVNATMFQRFLGAKDLNGVSWTLQVEWVFYFALSFFILIRGINKRNIFYSWVSFVLLSLACSIIRFYFNKKAPSALPIGVSFILLAAFWVLSSNKVEKYLILFFHIFLIVFMCSLLSYSKFWGYDDSPHSFVISDFLALGMFFLFKKYGIYSRFLNFFGTISFSLYLLHKPVRALTALFVSDPVWSVFFAFMSSIALSCLVFKLIEEPLNHFARKAVAKKYLK